MVKSNIFIFIVLSLLFSLAIDVLLGEMPSKIHPVVIIGKFIDFFKNIFIKIKNRFSGFLTSFCVISVSCVILYIIYYFISFNYILMFIIFSILFSSTFSVKMLLKTALDVKNDLDESIDKARKSVSYLVSRNTDELTECFIVSATIESLTENITDSYVAVILYYFVFSFIVIIYDINLYYLLIVPFIYRIFNTLDAMLGYKTDKLIYIGFFPAKVDDILNYIPARISGIYIVISSYLLKLDGKNAFKIMIRDARNCPSPNSGYTMASTAGALNIQLIKKDTYILGDSINEITSHDILNATKLSSLSIILFTLTVIILYILIWVII